MRLWATPRPRPMRLRPTVVVRYDVIDPSNTHSLISVRYQRMLRFSRSWVRFARRGATLSAGGARTPSNAQARHGVRHPNWLLNRVGHEGRWNQSGCGLSRGIRACGCARSGNSGGGGFMLIRKSIRRHSLSRHRETLRAGSANMFQGREGQRLSPNLCSSHSASRL